MTNHIPVLLNETIEGLNVKPDGIYVDLTLGRGGHSKEVLKRLTTGRLISFDKDETAIEESKQNLAEFSAKFTGIHDDFRNFRKNLDDLGIDKIDGIMADLGVSSPQFDDVSRGFSYKDDARLDMRMDRRQKFSAYELINTYSLTELTRVFREYGEDKFSYQIAKKIVEIRAKKTIETTSELVEIIKSVKPQKELMKKGHPAKQIFQAIRIEVNDELGALKVALKDALASLKVGGRACFITFHSLEDRLVKNAFNEVSKIEGTRHNVFALPTEKDLPDFKLINNKVIIANEKELEINPRSKSAKLRIIERVK
jgi:16S rRNA (cytosine1402-N4)-methyltransferase